MGLSRETVVIGGGVAGVVGGTGISVYMAERDSAPHREEGYGLLAGACDDPVIQEEVAGAVEQRLADNPGIDPTDVPGTTIASDGTVDVASSPDACVAAIEHGGNGISTTARRAIMDMLMQTNPDLAAKINEQIYYFGPWAPAALIGSLAILGGTAWVFKEIFISSK